MADCAVLIGLRQSLTVHRRLEESQADAHGSPTSRREDNNRQLTNGALVRRFEKAV